VSGEADEAARLTPRKEKNEACAKRAEDLSLFLFEISIRTKKNEPLKRFIF
jgi:hypothetical protein